MNPKSYRKVPGINVAGGFFHTAFLLAQTLKYQRLVYNVSSRQLQGNEHVSEYKYYE